MRIDLTYEYLTTHIVPGPQSLSYFVTLILLPIALLIPRTTLSKWQSILLFLPSMTLSTIHAWSVINGVDVISVDTLLWAFFLLAFKDPWQDFRLVKGLGKPSDHAVEVPTGLPATREDGTTATLLEPADVSEQPRPSSPKPQADGQPYPTTNLWSRILWTNTLLVSIRLNNWKINSQSHDRTQPPPPAFNSRKAFVITSLLSFARGYLLLDLTRAYVSYDPYFTDPSISISAPLPFSALWLLPPHLLRTMVVGAQAWALISQMFYPPCLLPVGLHALGLLPDEWSPHLWPPYFGSPRAIFLHGVRGFWGTYWHQTMRFSVSGPGYSLANAIGLRGNSMLRYSLITISAFGLSGAVHMGLVPPEPLHATMHVNSIRLCVAGFFWVQALAMLVEVLVARLFVTAMGLHTFQTGQGVNTRMILNGVWVVAWFSASIIPLAEAGRQLDYWRYWIVPVSLWKGLGGEGWIAWPFLNS